MSRWLLRSGIPRPASRGRWRQTCLETNGLLPFQRSLERDCSSTTWWSFTGCQYYLCLGIKGKMYTVHTSALPFKDNRLWNQGPTWASNLARTSNQFCSSWRSGPNHTLRMWMGPLLQQKGPGRESPPPNSKHPAANLRSCQSWLWHLPPSCTSWLPICPVGCKRFAKAWAKIFNSVSSSYGPVVI